MSMANNNINKFMVRKGAKCHICHTPAGYILRLGHVRSKLIMDADGIVIDDLTSGYGEDFPYCKPCFEAIKEEVYNG